MNVNWRILTAIVVLCWGGYLALLKAVAGRLAWQLSLLWFVVGYAVMVAGFCVATDPGLIKNRMFQAVSVWPLLCGLLCGVGGIAFFKALPLAPGSVLMPLVGLNVLVAAVACMIFLHEPFTWRVGAGIVCATAAVMLLGR